MQWEESTAVVRYCAEFIYIYIFIYLFILLSRPKYFMPVRYIGLPD